MLVDATCGLACVPVEWHGPDKVCVSCSHRLRFVGESSCSGSCGWMASKAASTWSSDVRHGSDASESAARVSINALARRSSSSTSSSAPSALLQDDGMVGFSPQWEISSGLE